MLDQQDIMILKNMMESVMDEKLAVQEASILAKVDEKLAQMEVSILEKVDEKIAKTENLILEELERTRDILEEKIQRVQNNIDELNQYYNITKLEKDNTILFLKRVDELEKRVEKLEEKQYREEHAGSAENFLAAEG